MKFLLIASFVAIALASPIDDKSPPARKSGPLDSSKTQNKPIPLNSAPLSPSPVDLHPLNKRDTQKSQTSSANSKKDQPAVVAAAPTAQKVDEKKTSDINRKTRDTAQKTAPTVSPSNAQAVKTNTQAQQPSNPKATQTQTQGSKKSREAPKVEDAKKTPTVNSQKSPSVVTSAPQVARVPLTSTNSRSKRDTSKQTTDQKQTLPAQTSDKKKTSDVPAATNTKPKRDTLADSTQSQSSKYDNPTPVRRPVPVDQVLKHKSAATTEASKVDDQQAQKA